MRGLRRHRAFSQKASFWILPEDISSPYTKERSQMSFLRFHKNSGFKLLNPENGLILWDEYTHHKAVAQKDSLQYSSEYISLLTTNLWAPVNIPSHIPQWQTFQTGQRRVSFTSMKWMHISGNNFLEHFFPGFIGGHCTFHHSLPCASEYYFFGFTEMVFKHCLMRKEV